MILLALELHCWCLQCVRLICCLLLCAVIVQKNKERGNPDLCTLEWLGIWNIFTHHLHFVSTITANRFFVIFKLMKSSLHVRAP